MTDETDSGEASERTELLDIRLDLIGQTPPHLKYVTLCLILIARARQEYAIRVQNSQIILQQPHVKEVALEPVLQHEQVHTNIIMNLVKSLYLALGSNLSFGHFKALLHLLSEPEIVLPHVTLFEDYGSNLSIGRVNPFLIGLPWR